MIETQDPRGTKYYIKSCTKEDLPMHARKVLGMIPDEDMDTYVEQMHKCIEAGTAYALEDDSCFIYYLNSSPAIAVGHAIYGKGAPMKFIALLMGVFNKIDKKTFKIGVVPHRENFLNEYRSIVTETSLRRRRMDPRRPLTIRIDNLKRQLIPLAAKFGVVWED